jgi:glycosyltransferase involved in cell wall biosynthesis
MRGYISWMARRSTLVVTDSEFSKQSLQDDIGLDPDRIVVLALAIDHDTAARIRTLRAAREPAARVMFVGRDAPHKNLDRLVQAFATTDFAREGAVLTLAGVDGPAVDRLRAIAAQSGARVELPGVVPQPALEDLLASATLVAQPSLEEGFGLPVVEALAAGIPVAMSTAPALLEITRGADVQTFDPRSVDAIAAAIDRVATSPVPVPQLDLPRPVDFAASVLDAMTRAEALA